MQTTRKTHYVIFVMPYPPISKLQVGIYFVDCLPTTGTPEASTFFRRYRHTHTSRPIRRRKRE
jgi:hypothetical protein